MSQRASFGCYDQFSHCWHLLLCHCSYQLAALNPSLINQGCTNLMPGESICLGITGEDCSATYVVQPSDTCDNIVAQNSLNMTILMMNNPQLDTPCDIYVGEVRVFPFLIVLYHCGGLSGDQNYIGRPFSVWRRQWSLNYILILTTLLQQVLCVAPTVQVPPIPTGGIPVSIGGSTSTVYSPTVYPPTSTPTAVVPTHTPAPKPAAPATTPTPTATPAAPAANLSSGDDEGDDNLPYCDEL